MWIAEPYKWLPNCVCVCVCVRPEGRSTKCSSWKKNNKNNWVSNALKLSTWKQMVSNLRNQHEFSLSTKWKTNIFLNRHKIEKCYFKKKCKIKLYEISYLVTSHSKLINDFKIKDQGLTANYSGLSQNLQFLKKGNHIPIFHPQENHS